VGVLSECYETGAGLTCTCLKEEHSDGTPTPAFFGNRSKVPVGLPLGIAARCRSACCSAVLILRKPSPSFLCSTHLSFRPQPVLHLGDETVGGEIAPDKHVIKDSISPNSDPLDNYFGF